MHASSAARFFGHIDALATSPFANHALAHELGELLGDPHLIAVPNARSTFALDVVLDGVPELVAPDAPAASRTLMSDDGTRHELATDDAANTRLHVRLPPTHGRPCQREMRPR